jgi:hypothetical protein
MDKPTAWYDPTNGMVSTDKDSPLFTPLGQVLPLYPQRTWAGLTLEEILETYRGPDGSDYVDYARGIEAKLRSKNE